MWGILSRGLIYKNQSIHFGIPHKENFSLFYLLLLILLISLTTDIDRKLVEKTNLERQISRHRLQLEEYQRWSFSVSVLSLGNWSRDVCCQLSWKEGLLPWNFFQRAGNFRQRKISLKATIKQCVKNLFLSNAGRRSFALRCSILALLLIVYLHIHEYFWSHTCGFAQKKV